MQSFGARTRPRATWRSGPASPGGWTSTSQRSVGCAGRGARQGKPPRAGLPARRRPARAGRVGRGARRRAASRRRRRSSARLRVLPRRALQRAARRSARTTAACDRGTATDRARAARRRRAGDETSICWRKRPSTSEWRRLGAGPRPRVVGPSGAEARQPFVDAAACRPRRRARGSRTARRRRATEVDAAVRRRRARRGVTVSGGCDDEADRRRRRRCGQRSATG